jgi:uncharacterized protein with HEPN domain
MKDDTLNITCIAESIARIESYTSEGREVFSQTPMIQDAVVRNFQVMGEATKNLSSDLRTTYADVPWRKIAGFRDVLVQDYLRIGLDIVWDIIQDELPPLKPRIAQILQELNQGS